MNGLEGYADFYGLTSLHPLAVAAVVILGLTTLAAAPRLALAPLVVAATTLPMAQRIVIAGADFTLMRILLLTYALRILLRKEQQGLRWGRVDTAVVLWTLAGVVIMTIHHGTADALINRLGWSFDIFVTYFAVRCLVRSVDDVLGLAKIVAVIAVPIAALFLNEWLTQRNLFSIFGGVPMVTGIREGRLRCQGAFAHPILAGTFWASTLPLIWMLWKHDGSARNLSILGTLAVLTIVFACSSSTPMLSVVVAAGGAMLFAYRGHRKLMWVSLVLVVPLLHILMDKPVWHLMARIDLVGGSTGWHRFRILDAFFHHFRSWFLTGDHDPQAWGVWEMRDITNQYILEGLRGGLLTLSLFILMLLRCFGSVGRTLKEVQHLKNTQAEKVVWLIGVTILVHAFTFLGVSYFGQMSAMLYIHLGLAGALVPQILPQVLGGTAAPASPPGTLGKSPTRRSTKQAPARRYRTWGDR